eukprot:3235601-Rhodomonas_salina.2
MRLDGALSARKAAAVTVAVVPGSQKRQSYLHAHEPETRSCPDPGRDARPHAQRAPVGGARVSPWPAATQHEAEALEWYDWGGLILVG